MKPNELIGRKFRRNVYGLSVWTHEIKRVSIDYRYVSGSYFAPTIHVLGENCWYDLNEIVLL